MIRIRHLCTEEMPRLLMPPWSNRKADGLDPQQAVVKVPGNTTSHRCTRSKSIESVHLHLTCSLNNSYSFISHLSRDSVQIPAYPIHPAGDDVRKTSRF